MCGVFGVWAPDRDVARLTYFGLHALQHRGQESAGIAVSDEGRLTVLRDLGLVTQVFSEENLGGLPVVLAEAALWSGLGVDVELPESGSAVISCAPENLDRLGGVPLLAVGVVGGDSVLGFGLDELGKAYGS